MHRLIEERGLRFLLTGSSARKLRRAVGRDDLRGLRELRKEGAFKRFVVASLEPRPRIVDGIEILPWRTFVERLWSGDFE